jgi:hypothetical protein
MDGDERLVDADEAARLLDRVADQVAVAPAPVERLVHAARRQRRRRDLLVTAELIVLVVLVVLASSGALPR